MPANQSSTPSSPRVLVPRATYRLQFHRGFTLRQALELVPYLDDLGISHIYCSPLLRACPGSMHGYDVCDTGQLNPELGTEDDFAELVSSLRQRGMGLVLDLVPNHMGISGTTNPWWWDVLMHGPNSRFARHFDIDWNSPDPRLRGKVLLPVLGDRYDRVLAKGELRLERSPEPKVLLRYHDHRFPLAPKSLDAQAPVHQEELDRINADPDKLDALLAQQFYRLTHWRNGDCELNYRRFFNITTLAGVRVENPHVFQDTHARILEWHRQQWLDGLRIDHPDGLWDPEQYLHDLHQAAPGAWIVIEKILETGESLPPDWPVAGTTGYDFLNRVGGVLVAAAAEKPLTDFYAAFTGEPTDFAAVVRERKRAALQHLLVTEVERLTRLWQALAAGHWRCRDFTFEQMRTAIVEVIANFPVYRTYVRAETRTVSDTDAAHIAYAVGAAQKQWPELDESLLEFLNLLLCRQYRGAREDEFVMRFQQLTGPAMAKGVEDTTFYCYNRFVALNEVGGDPGHFGLSLEAFHRSSVEAQQHWPQAMLASSTHDTKRSEDVRARLSLLSEIPDRWIAAVQQWSAHNERHRRNQFPDRNAEYLFYQTLVGAWPLPTERALAYMEKASCEAKQHTTWTERNADYDKALQHFVTATLADDTFTGMVRQFVEPLLEPGWINSLVQTLIKLSAPGVPDIYQGTELWDLSLVDPDNRRPVDFVSRQRLLHDVMSLSAAAAWSRRKDGVPKLWLIHKILTLRRRHPDWFEADSVYHPISVHGPNAPHVIAFGRGDRLVTVTPRWVIKRPTDWGTTELELPAGRWRNELTGETSTSPRWPLEALLTEFPVALLINTADS